MNILPNTVTVYWFNKLIAYNLDIDTAGKLTNIWRHRNVPYQWDMDNYRIDVFY